MSLIERGVFSQVEPPKGIFFGLFRPDKNKTSLYENIVGIGETIRERIKERSYLALLDSCQQVYEAIGIFGYLSQYRTATDIMGSWRRFLKNEGIGVIQEALENNIDSKTKVSAVDVRKLVEVHDKVYLFIRGSFEMSFLDRAMAKTLSRLADCVLNGDKEVVFLYDDLLQKLEVQKMTSRYSEKKLWSTEYICYLAAIDRLKSVLTLGNGRKPVLVGEPSETKMKISLPAEIDRRARDVLTSEFGEVLEIFEGGQFWVFKVRRRDRIVAINVFKNQNANEIKKNIEIASKISLAKRTAPDEIKEMMRSVDEVVFRPEGISYIISPWIDGKSLRKTVEEKRFLPQKAARLILKQAKLLHYLHSKQGVVIADFNPNNIIYTPEGEAVVMDWGCLVFAREGNHQFSTPEFCAPEQWDGYSLLLPQVDVYSLGVTLYFLLTGKGQACTSDPDCPVPLYGQPLEVRFPGVEKFPSGIKDVIEGCTIPVYDRKKGSSLRWTASKAVDKLEDLIPTLSSSREVFKV